METTDIGKDFYPRLVNRNSLQGDGSHNAIQFRKRFLAELDSVEAWNNLNPICRLDFSNVRKIGPSFANEAFGYFAKYWNQPDDFFKKVEIINESVVQRGIIETELRAAHER